MTNNWQAWAAPLVVGVTLLLMAYKVFAKKKPGCSSGCGCANPITPRRRSFWKAFSKN